MKCDMTSFIGENIHGRASFQYNSRSLWLKLFISAVISLCPNRLWHHARLQGTLWPTCRRWHHDITFDGKTQRRPKGTCTTCWWRHYLVRRRSTHHTWFNYVWAAQDSFHVIGPAGILWKRDRDMLLLGQYSFQAESAVCEIWLFKMTLTIQKDTAAMTQYLVSSGIHISVNLKSRQLNCIILSSNLV